MNALQALHQLCTAKRAKGRKLPKTSNFRAALHALHGTWRAKGSKKHGFLRFAALHALHSLKREGSAVQSTSPSSLEARPFLVVRFI